MGKNPQNMLIQSGTNFSKFLSNHFSRFVKHVHFSSWHCKPGKFIPSIVRKILQNHLSRLCSTLHSVQIRCESFGMLCRKPGKWVGIRGLRPDFVAKAFFWKAFIKEMLQVASNCGATHPADPNLFIVYKMPKNSLYFLYDFRTKIFLNVEYRKYTILHKYGANFFLHNYKQLLNRFSTSC